MENNPLLNHKHINIVKVYIIILILFWCSISTILLSLSLPYNPLAKYLLGGKNKFNLFLPQGWAFFTKDPRYIRMIYLVKIDGKWVQDPRLRNGTLNNYLGAGRFGRALHSFYATEIGPKTEKLSWFVCPDSVFYKLNLSSIRYRANDITIDNRDDLNFPKQIIIEKMQIVPWAYRDHEGKTGSLINFIKLNIQTK